MDPTMTNPLLLSNNLIGNGDNNTNNCDVAFVEDSSGGNNAAESRASQCLGSELIRQSQQQQQQQLQHLEQLQQQQIDNLGNATDSILNDIGATHPNRSAITTFNQFQNPTFGNLQTSVIMNALQTTPYQGTENGNIHNVRNLFTAMGAENLLAVAMAAANNNVMTVNSQNQKSPELDFQQLSNHVISGQTNPVFGTGSVLGERQDQRHPQQPQQPQNGIQNSLLDQLQPRKQIPQFLGRHEDNVQNPVTTFDRLQQMQSLSRLGGPTDLDNNTFHENTVKNQPIANAAGDVYGVLHARRDSLGGIQLLQQQLASLQQQLQQQQILRHQQQPNLIHGINQQPEQQQLQQQKLLLLQMQINDQSMQIGPQAQFTQVQQQQNKDNVAMPAWMQGPSSDQISAQNLGQNFNLAINPLSFNGSLLGVSEGNNIMSGLHHFQEQTQGQQPPSTQQSLGLLTGASSNDDCGIPTNQFGVASNEPLRLPDLEPSEPPLKSKKSKEGNDKKKKSKTFPEKLMQAIMEYADEEAIAWLPDGKSFVIVNPDLFCSDILSQVFKESKYASFIRKLHRWGFVRLTSGTGTDCFHHPLFQKNRNELVSKIVCAPRGELDEKINPRIKNGIKPPSLAGVEKFIRAKVVADAASAAANPDNDDLFKEDTNKTGDGMDGSEQQGLEFMDV